MVGKGVAHADVTTIVCVQLVRALEKNWMSRRLLLWRHQREATEAQQVSMMIHHERQTMEECSRMDFYRKRI